MLVGAVSEEPDLVGLRKVYKYAHGNCIVINSFCHLEVPDSFRMVPGQGDSISVMIVKRQVKFKDFVPDLLRGQHSSTFLSLVVLLTMVRLRLS